MTGAPTTRTVLSGAVGAVVAQSTQALSSFLLMVMAARTLGLEQFGIFAVLYGTIVLLTAITSGFIGDSLTVLDRRERAIRGALEGWGLALVAAATVVGATVALSLGFLQPGETLLFAAAIAFFLLEDILRRTLMAEFVFLRIGLVDLSSLAISLLVLFVWLTQQPLNIASFLIALAAGQAVGMLVAVLSLPAGEQYLVRPARHWPEYRKVAEYGVWRAAQQSIRPALLTAVRLSVLVVAGAAATGALEGARIYVAPAMLLISGMSAYLFVSYANQSETPLARLLRLADRGVAILLGVTLAGGAVAIAALPVMGPWVTGQSLSLPAVAGWLAYAASVAAVTPYGTLAAVRGKQAQVFAVRVFDSLLSLATAVILLASGVDYLWVPLSMVIGSLTGGLAIRHFLLGSLIAREQVVRPDTAAPHERQSSVNV